MLCMEFRFRKYRLMNIKYKCRLPRGVIQRWRFFSLAPFFNLNRLIKHHNILRNTNLNNRRNETNIDISLRVSNTNHLKLVQIYLPNPVHWPLWIKVHLHRSINSRSTKQKLRLRGPYGRVKLTTIRFIRKYLNIRLYPHLPTVYLILVYAYWAVLL